MFPADLPLRYKFLLRTYRWRRAEAVPAARLTRPVAQARVALVTSAGFVAPGDAPFDLDLAGGDASFRTIAGDARLDALSMHHKSDAYDPGPLVLDRNVAFPLDRLRALAKAGGIGEVAPRHLSFMGSITRPERLIAEFAPAAAALLAGDGVDIALLVPV
jgi:D-proline reductase (dithiol) PrdB